LRRWATCGIAAEQRDTRAHDYLLANAGCPAGKHYALALRRFRKRADGEAKRSRRDAQPGGLTAVPEAAQRLAPFKNHTAWCCELIDGGGDHQLPGTLALESYCTKGPVWNHIAGHERA
jgi:hypothetical protein